MPVTASSASLRLPPMKRVATAALATRRLRSHSHGAGKTSSKSLIANTNSRSAEPNTPKFETCMSPQA